MEKFVNFETFDFVSPNQCDRDPTDIYSMENFSNNLGVPFAAIPLNLTNDDFQDLNKLHVENICPYKRDTDDLARCDIPLSEYGVKPQSYYQDSTYRDNIEHYFKGYEALKSEPKVTNRLADLIVRVTNQVAKILPGTLMAVRLFMYAEESEMIRNYSGS